VKKPTLGPIVYAFFVEHLRQQKGLRPASIRSYRDALRLFLNFTAHDAGRKVSRLSLQDLTFERVLAFLRHLEEDRYNHIQTRNHRLAVLHTFFEYLVTRVPEMLPVAGRVAAIPRKRVAPPETRYLTRDEVASLFAGLPSEGRLATRDRALLLFLYNTGARVQEVASVRVVNLDLGVCPSVRLHGKGDKWRTCPLWEETTKQLRLLLEQRGEASTPQSPVFLSATGDALTRYGIYKIVRRHARLLDEKDASKRARVTPHVLRHTTAVHLLEAGVDVNVIRGWLGHVSLDTTNRYAEISAKAKAAALSACEPPISTEACPRTPVWRNNESLLAWLDSL
jgi:site-specific recombinase XerD